jgi:RimJ/RimL family protein N-acetyltransferase
MIRCTMSHYDMVYEILTDPSVFDWISDDGSRLSDMDLLVEAYLSNDRIYVLMPNDLSVFLAVPTNFVTYEIHTNILPEGRGKMAVLAANECTEWMFRNTPCMKLSTWVPENNRKAKMFALLCGMRVEGNSRLSFLKDGKLQDQFLMGLTREDWLCQQQ